MNFGRIASRIAADEESSNPTQLAKGTSIEDFWSSLDETARDALLDLEPDGRAGAQVHQVPGVGKVTCWLDACSEGADRGGYVTYLELHDILRPNGEPVVLESETDGSEYYFDGRSSRL